MSTTLLPFIPSSAPSRPMPTGGRQVLPFLTKQEFAQREYTRIWAAYEEWVLGRWALPPGTPMEEPPCDDIAVCGVIEQMLRWRRRRFHLFETVQRTPPRHPLWRLACWCGRSADRFFNRLQTALLIYFGSLGLTAFPLFAHGQWVGGMVMATAGSGFGWLLLERWRQRATTVDDAENAARGWKAGRTIVST